MSTAILKWGNSQGVRLSTTILRQAKFSLVEPVEIKAELGRIVIERAKPKVVLADLLAQIPAHTEIPLIDYGPAVGAEWP